jgi:ATP-dependent metalloprotease
MCKPFAVRNYSTLTRLGPFKLNTSFRPGNVGLSQYRTIYGGNASRNVLAHLEQTANNNPHSATAQNAFYSALLRANMPDLVVQRYQSGRFATNAAADATYYNALERLQQPGQANAMQNTPQGGQQGLMPEQLQSVARAVANKARGGNTTHVQSGNGTAESPLRVIVDEPTSRKIFGYIKFIIYMAITCYVALVLINLLVETSGMLRKVGGAQNAEARPELQTTRFSDVHGCEEAKEELQEIVEFLKSPEKFSNLGGKLPKGVLLTGPPGTGKTLLARAVAGEAGVPFFYMSGSEFDEVYVGVGAKRVRELFNAARAKAPAIVFIDELDAIGGKRNERDAAYVKQTLNQLLTDLDGFDQNSGVIFLAATNFPELLDKALTRPGRFDRNVAVPLPDVRGRLSIIKHYLRNTQISTDVDAAVLARGTPGFSGADLENIVNMAAVHASKNKQKKVTMLDLEWAKDRVLMGAERRSQVVQEKDKIATAYHEGGHALVAMYTPGAMPLYKATIMPRGHALGITFQLPEMDQLNQSREEMEADLDVAMGGQAAEELIYGQRHATGGCYSDLSQATKVAYAMVTMYGMSERLGSVDMYNNRSKLSPRTLDMIDEEVRTLLNDSKARAMKLLKERRAELDLLAKGLVEYENLTKDEMEKIVKGQKLPDKLKADPSVPIRAPELPITAKSPAPVPTGDDDPGTGVPQGGDAFPAS